MARQTRISLAILAPLCLTVVALTAIHFTPSAASAETAVGAGLELRVSARTETFLQGEPVPIGVEIINRSQDVVHVEEALEPKYLMLRFRVTDPEGRTYIPGPPTVASFESSELALGPGEKLSYTALLLFGLVEDVGEFIFIKTGKYRVQALYYAGEAVGGTISSEPLMIRVVQPDDVEREAKRLFVGLEQGRLASGFGASRAALDGFQAILRKYPRSRFAPYVAYYLGLHYFRQKDYKQSIELLERVLAEYKDFPLKAELRYRLAGACNDAGRKAEAKKLLTDLIAKEPSDLFARRAERLLRELKSD